MGVTGTGGCSIPRPTNPCSRLQDAESLWVKSGVKATIQNTNCPTPKILIGPWCFTCTEVIYDFFVQGDYNVFF